jgi:hypothetical protein
MSEAPTSMQSSETTAPTSTESNETTAPPEPNPVSATPSHAAAAHRSPVDQVKDAAKKILGLITGRK